MRPDKIGLRQAMPEDSAARQRAERIADAHRRAAEIAAEDRAEDADEPQRKQLAPMIASILQSAEPGQDARASARARLATWEDDEPPTEDDLTAHYLTHAFAGLSTDTVQ